MEEQEEQQKQNNDYLYSKFVNSLKSKTTKFFYVRRVKYFMDFLGLISNEYSKLVDQKKDRKAIENDINSFLIYLRKDRKISYRSASYYLDALKKFYYVNSDYDFKWKLIKSYLGEMMTRMMIMKVKLRRIVHTQKKKFKQWFVETNKTDSQKDKSLILSLVAELRANNQHMTTLGMVTPIIATIKNIIDNKDKIGNASNNVIHNPIQYHISGKY